MPDRVNFVKELNAQETSLPSIAGDFMFQTVLPRQRHFNDLFLVNLIGLGNGNDRLSIFWPPLEAGCIDNDLVHQHDGNYRESCPCIFHQLQER